MSLTSEQLCDKIKNSVVINSDGYGVKVYKLDNGHYFKVFRIKKLFSSGSFWHYADRFYKNSIILEYLKIPSIKVHTVYNLPKDFIPKSIKTKSVEYSGLEGVCLRDYIHDSKLNDKQSQSLAQELMLFINKLHKLGIYFRAVHFGNIIYNSSFPDKFGLIDIDNMKFYKKALNKNLVRRNLKHLTAYDEDKYWLKSYLSDGYSI